MREAVILRSQLVPGLATGQLINRRSNYSCEIVQRYMALVGSINCRQ